MGPQRKLIVALVPLLVALLGKCQSPDMLRSLPKNVSGYLVSRDGQFYVQPALENQSSNGERGVENESRANDEESWTEGGEESWRSDKEPVDGDDEDDDESWSSRRGSLWWWERGTRSRGFSIFGMLESAVGMVGKFLGGMIFEDEEDIESKDSAANYRGHQLLRLTAKTKKQVRYLQQLMTDEPDDVKFWTNPVKDKATDVLVSSRLLNDVKEFFREKGINYVMLMSDLEKAIKSQNPRMPKERRQDLFSSQGHAMTWKRYHRFKDVMGYLDYLASKYPQIVEVVSIGKSFEGRPLKIVKVSTGANVNGEPKPTIWIDAGMHAREWISVAVTTYILNQLVEKNENYTRLLDITDWVIMPVANPDGYEYTHTDDRLWRKTRSNHDAEPQDDTRQAPGFLHVVSQYTKWLFGGSCEGVDPNRNFHIHWGDDKIGASTDPCADTYQGPSPFSEPETRAISNYIMKNKKFIKSYLTMHSYSQMILCCGLTRTRPADFDDLMNIANKAKKAIAKVNGIEYRVGSAAELLYPTTGSSDDWAKEIAGIKNSFTIELRDRGNYGFLLPASQIIPTARETWAGVRVIARMSAAQGNNT
ncbi:carboxypeptidase A2-like [Copidosoma floridanum]|uniref:carboxypeptidase A2-like n=1 Tax=Copidosoma floridanum TaxID=29053 RepID=UPI000C6F6EEB|nr:carboxypeptidase A2-like [Copidosoma floridanum]